MLLHATNLNGVVETRKLAERKLDETHFYLLWKTGRPPCIYPRAEICPNFWI